MNSVLLTVDLTKAVADEAIERKDSIVVAYRMRCPWLLDYSSSTDNADAICRPHHLQRPQELDFQ
jgi:hypothetical protein